MAGFTNYYRLRKNGDVVWQASRPKADHVIEMVDYGWVDAGGIAASKHVLTHSRTGETHTLIGRCGYDRGPKLQAKIREMLEE